MSPEHTADKVLKTAKRAEAAWRGATYVRDLSRAADATLAHWRELLGMLVAHRDTSGVGAVLAAHLRGNEAAPGLSDIETAISGLGRAGTDDDRFPENTREADRMRRAAVIWWGLLGASGSIVSERLAALTRGGPGPFGGPFELETGVQLSISEAGERALYGEGWWPVLTGFNVSDSGFDYLMGKVEDGEMVREALSGTANTPERLGRVIEHAERRGEVLEAEFVRYYKELLAGDAGLLRRVLAASGCEAEALFELGYRDGWGWDWVDPEWLESLGTSASTAISRVLPSVGEAPGERRCCDAATMRLVLTHVRGAAAGAATPEGAGTFARGLLVSILDERFGEDREVAWSLINPATNLVELTDVVGRL